MLPDLFGGPNRDEVRHKEKVREALKDRLPTVVTNKTLITSPKGTKVTVPVTVLEDPIFRTAPAFPHVGDRGPDMGPGKPGKVVGTIPFGDDEPQSGAGSEDGLTYGIEIDVDELAELVFEHLKLPPIKSVEGGEMVEEVRPESRQKRGVHLDKKATLIEHIKRGVVSGNDEWSNQDLRYREFVRRERPDSRSVVVLVRDASGSITERMAYTTVAASWWIVKWLRRHYPTTEVRFILHGTEAIECTEKEFFSEVWMGGTYCSTGIAKAAEILAPYDGWAKYLIYYSDGDNFPSDEALLGDAVAAIADELQVFAYGELTYLATPRTTSVMSTLKSLCDEHPSLRVFTPLIDSTVGTFLQHVFGGDGDAS